MVPTRRVERRSADYKSAASPAMLGGLLLIRLGLGDSYRLKRYRVTTGAPFSEYPLRASPMRISVPRLTATAAGERHPERYHLEGRRTVVWAWSSVKRGGVIILWWR